MNKTTPTLIRENEAMKMLGFPPTVLSRACLRANCRPEIVMLPRATRLYRPAVVEELRIQLELSRARRAARRRSRLLARTLDNPQTYPLEYNQ